MVWEVVDAHEVDLDQIEQFSHTYPADVALMAEYIHEMRYSFDLRDYLLCVVDSRNGALEGLCWLGGNIVPVNLPETAAKRVVREVRRRAKRFSSIVGPSQQVDLVWKYARGRFGQVREIRSNQPHLEIQHPPLVEQDERVQPVTTSDFDVVFPAAVAMFTEEVGYSPLASGSGYERRMRSLVTQGRTLARIDDGPGGREVVFKADLGTMGFGLTQIQGVWINPRYRGRGLAAPAVAAVVNYAHRHFAPTVSLYVNSFNEPALATYARVGFTQTHTFTTILF